MHQFLVAVFDKRKLISQINLYALSVKEKSDLSFQFFIFRILKLHKKNSHQEHSKSRQISLAPAKKSLIMIN